MKEITSSLEAARQYRAAGMYPIPLIPGEKRPKPKKWETMLLDADELPGHFLGDVNIGLLLGDASGGLVDVDLDAPEAVRAAPFLLPRTARKHGRPGKPASHWWYRVESCGTTQRFKADGASLCEYRANGGQTMVPPSRHPSGEVLRWVEDGETAQVSGAILQTAVSRVAAAALLARNWPSEGSRQDCALALAGVLIKGGFSVVEAEVFIRAVCTAAGHREDPNDLESRIGTVAQTRRKYSEELPITGVPRLAEYLGESVVDRACEWLGIQVTPAGPQPTATSRSEPETDLANARRLVARFGSNFHYIASQKVWLLWDGGRWVRGGALSIEPFAKQIAQELDDEARACFTDQRPSLLRRAKRAGSGVGIRTMIALARSEPGVCIDPNALDRDPWLLNAPNGTVDLRTGELRPHSRRDLLTRMTASPFEPNTECDRFDAFLRRILPDAEIRTFVQKAFGYTLIGANPEELLFLVVGPPASGKSTLQEGLVRALGDYAATASFSTFVRRPRGNAINNDIARLNGPHLVTCSELNRGERLDEALAKQLTGGDTVTARFLYSEHFEFRPRFTPVFVANHAPVIDPEDDAVWRRVVKIPFDVSVPKDERDPSLKRYLLDPASAGAAILVWAVRGCLAWQQDGKLIVPESVSETTEAYRLELGGLSGFLAGCCEANPNAWVPRTRLWEEYQAYALSEGEDPIPKSDFYGRVEGRGYEATKRQGTRGFSGVRLRPSTGGQEGQVNNTVSEDEEAMETGRIATETAPLPLHVQHRDHRIRPDNASAGASGRDP